MGPDEQAIREVHSIWIDAVNAGDLDRLLSLMADDVVFLNPGREPVGRDGFVAGLEAAQQRARIRCVSELQEVVVVGEVAYARSADSLSMTPLARSTGSGRAASTGSGQAGPASETTHLAGHRLTVYRKHPDGRWLLARDAHTLSVVKK